MDKFRVRFLGTMIFIAVPMLGFVFYGYLRRGESAGEAAARLSAVALVIAALVALFLALRKKHTARLHNRKLR